MKNKRARKQILRKVETSLFCLFLFPLNPNGLQWQQIKIMPPRITVFHRLFIRMDDVQSHFDPSTQPNDYAVVLMVAVSQAFPLLLYSS